MQVTGIGSFGIGLIGEAPGEMEAREQRGFVEWAPAGSVLERTLRRLGYSRDQFFIANTIFCRPKENFLDGAPWEFPAIRHCQPNLLGALRQHKPKILVALGGIAFRTLTGISGKQRGVSHMRGYVFRALPEYCDAASNPDLLVIPTYHPSFLRRGAIHLTGVFARDIQRAVNIRAGKDKSFILDMPLMSSAEDIEDPFNSPEEQHSAGQVQASISAWMRRHNLDYILHPTLAQLDSFCREVKQRSDAWLALPPDMQRNDLTALSWDLETRESADLGEDASDGFTDTYIKQIQFSIATRSGLAFPWQGDYIQAARWLLKLPLPKLGQNNWLFDDRVVLAVGKRDYANREYFRPAGRSYDIMQMFHYWQPDLPAHLQAAASFVQFEFAWKHLGDTNLPFYGCLTAESRVILADGTARRIEDIVKRRESVLVRSMNARGQLINVRIVGWKRVKVVGQKWLRLDTEATDQPLFLTPDHEVWCNDSWVPASEVKVGDVVRSARLGSADLIHGTLLGDSHCDARGRLSFTHCEAQKEWFDAKRFAFEGPEYKIEVKPREIKKGSGLVGAGIHYRTEAWVSPTLWRKRFYNDDGRKLFVPPSDRALAVWYCDDGCWAISRRSKRKGHLGNPRIIVQCFANLDFLIDWFRLRFGSENVSYYPDKRSVQGGAIALIGAARHEFFSIVAPFVEPSMSYKLPPQYRGRYDGWLDQCIPQETVVSAISDYDPGRRNRNYRYCITVNNQEHRFFAMGGLVKNCVDVDAPIRIWHMLAKTMRERGIWDDAQRGRNAAGYVNMVEAVRPILAAMEDRGFPVDNERRLALDVEFSQAEKEARVELDAKFPEAARKIDPKQGYKGVPPRVKLLLTDGLTDAEAETRQFQDPPSKNDDGTLNPSEFFYFKRREFKLPVVGADGEPATEPIQRWCRVYEFSPNSPKQLKQYMDVRQHKVPKKKSGEDTTGKIELQRMASKYHDDFYLKVIECREIGKMRGTYIDGFKPQQDGLVHTTFTFATSTGQLTSRNPVNFQNVPKHGRLAKPIRSMFRSLDGRLIVEWDKKSYHVMTTGFEAKCIEYMRIARLDMHSFVAGHFNKDWDAFKIISETDDELMERFRWFKKDPARKLIRDKKAKPSILGIGFGLGEKKLYDMNRESFKDQKEATYLRNILKELFKPVFVWQNQIRELAHRQQYLRNRFGMIRWFFEVYVPDKHGGWAAGEQSEQAIAFLPASDAFGDIREIMKELARRGLDEKWSQCNTVHDSIVFLVKPSQLEEHCHEMYPVLSAPSKVLIDADAAPGGLVVDIECSVGESWAEMKEVDLKGLGGLVPA